VEQFSHKAGRYAERDAGENLEAAGWRGDPILQKIALNDPDIRAGGESRAKTSHEVRVALDGDHPFSAAREFDCQHAAAGADLVHDIARADRAKRNEPLGHAPASKKVLSETFLLLTSFVHVSPPVVLGETDTRILVWSEDAARARLSRKNPANLGDMRLDIHGRKKLDVVF